MQKKYKSFDNFNYIKIYFYANGKIKLTIVKLTVVKC